MDARLVVGRLLVRRAEPHLVVEVGGHGLDFRRAARLVAAAADLDAHDVADAPVQREFAHAVELHHAALPRAHLHHAVLELREVRDDAALGDRLRERLLQPDVLALRERGTGDERVPVVGEADLHGVDGRIVQQVVVVGERLDGRLLLLRQLLVPLLDEVHAMREALGVEVADRREAAEVRVLDRERDVHRGGDAADADHAHVDFFVGGVLAHVQPRAAGEDEREGGGRGGAEELATVDVHWCILLFCERRFIIAQNVREVQPETTGWREM